MTDTKQESGQPHKVPKRDKIILIGLVAFVIIATIVYFSVTWQKSDTSETEIEPVDNLMTSEIDTVTATEVNQLLNSGEPIILLDVRQPIEYAEEHIDGATNIEVSKLEDMKKYLPTDIEIITMCDGSNCHRSTGAAEMLLEWGFKRIRDFTGGIKEWNGEALPTTIGVVSKVDYFEIPEISPAELDAYIDSGVGINVLDVRTSDYYNSGHITGARNISFADAEMLAQTNAINLDKPIVVYGGETDVKAKMTAQTMLANGAKDVSIISGGYSAWKQADY